jgi:RsiW-degrading membrane proteinase PrsW (M82 family)
MNFMNFIFTIVTTLFLFAMCLLPGAAFFVWLRRGGRRTISLLWFLASFAAGLLSAGAGLLLMGVVPIFESAAGINTVGKIAGLYNVFVRTALVEEVSRLIVFSAFFAAARRMNKLPAERSFYVSAAIIAGLGFAAAESVFFALDNFNVVLLRAITTAPIHAACAARIGAAIWSRRQKESLAAVRNFLYAFALHGIYDYLIPRGGISSIIACACAILNCLSAIASLEKKSIPEIE